MRITEIPRSEIVVYCRHGLISPLEGPPEDEWHFDATAVHALRRLAYLRTQFALNRTGPRLSLPCYVRLNHCGRNCGFAGTVGDVSRFDVNRPRDL